MCTRKSRCTLLSVNAPDVAQKREKWTEKLSEYDKEKLVFLDESGINTDMARIYGRALGGKRCIDKAPVNTPKNTTILSSVRLNGETAYTTYQGGTKIKNFTEYLKNVLAPTIHEDDIVVMDNMSTHHSKDVRKTIEELYYHLFQNPISEEESKHSK